MGSCRRNPEICKQIWRGFRVWLKKWKTRNNTAVGKLSTSTFAKVVYWSLSKTVWKYRDGEKTRFYQINYSLSERQFSNGLTDTEFNVWSKCTPSSKNSVAFVRLGEQNSCPPTCSRSTVCQVASLSLRGRWNICSYRRTANSLTEVMNGNTTEYYH